VDVADAILADVIENPDDDAPRLVYADWCEDRGDAERAELIRAQLRLARMAEGDPEREGLERRERELLDEHATAWAEPLRGLAAEVGYCRGFVEAVEVIADVASFAECIRRAMAAAPVRSLRLVGGPDGVLAAGPCLERLRELFLGLEGGQHDLRPLLESGRFDGLTTFLVDCDDAHVDPEDFFRPEALTRLRRLGLRPDYGTVADDEAMLEGLVGVGGFANLRALHLVGFVLDEHAGRLAGCPAFSGLEELDLRRCLAIEERWRELLWAPPLRGLRRLDLTGAVVRGGNYDDEPLSLFDLAGEIASRFPGATFMEDDASWPFVLPTWAGWVF
jgi:uncharacterized protein (TIGR02996 family)